MGQIIDGIKNVIKRIGQLLNLLNKQKAEEILDGRYRVIKQIGEGGMGAVFLAEDLRLERQVAIKRLQLMGKRADLAMFQKRFEREAKEMARFQHTNIVSVHDYGQDEEGIYLVLEYMPGGTLSSRMKNGSVSVDEAIKISVPLAKTLQIIHDLGLVHRDIKPSNILFDAYGVPKLADFGIVKLVEGSEGYSLTVTGAVVGTPAYMAPELIGGEASPATDQYALGVVLYEMVTGKKPFEGRTPVETLTMQKYESLPDPLEYNSSLPDWICQVLSKALAKKVSDRYRDMDSFVESIESRDFSPVDKGFEQKNKSENLEEDRFKTILPVQLSETKTKIVEDSAIDELDMVVEPKPEKKHKGLMFAGITIVVIMVIFFGAWGIIGGFGRKETPETTGVTINTSKPSQTKPLMLTITDISTSSKTATMTKSPKPTSTPTRTNTLEPTQTSTSLPDGYYIMPDIVGKSFSEVKDQLDKGNVKYSIIVSTDTQYSNGQILKASIEPNQVTNKWARLTVSGTLIDYIGVYRSGHKDINVDLSAGDLILVMNTYYHCFDGSHTELQLPVDYCYYSASINSLNVIGFYIVPTDGSYYIKSSCGLKQEYTDSISSSYCSNFYYIYKLN